MKSRTVELAVGIFVILFVLACFLLAMRVSGLSGSNMGDTYTLTARFDNISGLKERAKVTIAGVKVGQVESIKLDPLSDQKAIVTMRMDKALTTFNPEQKKELEKYAVEDLKLTDAYSQATPEQQKVLEQQQIDKIKNMKNMTDIDQNASIKVATNGIIGEKYLKIDAGGATTYLPEGGSFDPGNTQGTVDIEDLVNKFITGSTGNKATSNSDSKATNSVPADSASASEASPF